MNVYELRCEYQNNPLGIDVQQPSLMWKLRSNERGDKQTAYQLVIMLHQDTVDQFDHCVFDSGKVMSEQSVHLKYCGPKLHSRQRYDWKVRVWDQHDQVSDWSDVAWWEMGLLHSTDWQATWLEPVQEVAAQETVKHPGELFSPVPDPQQLQQRELMPCQYLRRRFNVVQNIAQARLYITAHGLYEAEINGQPITDKRFTPGVSAYEHCLEYQVYDVTEQLQQGGNVLAVTLADGWYVGRLGLPGVNRNYGDKVGVLFQLEIYDQAGELTRIVSDRQTVSSTGPLRYSDLYIGESFDATLENEGWNLPDYDDQTWQASLENHQYGVENLCAESAEPVRVVKEITDIQVIHTPAGEQLIDLGQVISGWVRMKVQGEKGIQIQLEYTEVLDEHGNFFRNIVGKNKDQTDVYTLKGQGVETWEPKFSFHGFRYVRVTGYPEPILADQFVGVVIGSDLQITGEFSCSDDKINRLQHCIHWSQRGNFISIPTDCPQREKAGWSGDINIYAPTATFNMHSHNFLKRWLNNMRLEQQQDGQIPIVVPFWKGDQKFSEMLLGQGRISSSGWGDVCIMLPWELWQKYGDSRILTEAYPSMQKWLDYVQQQAQSHISESALASGDARRIENQKYLWNSGFHFGDWFTPSFLKQDPSNNGIMHCAHTTKDLVSSAFYAHSTRLFAQTSALLGESENAEKYQALHHKIKQAFCEEYFDSDYRLTPHYQGAYVLALAFELVPEDAVSTVIGHLATLIRDNDYRLDTGFMSVSFLLDVLSRHGHEALSWQLLFQNQQPSWLYEVEKGATTLWERWDNIGEDHKPLHSSYNHYAFGCVGDWLYKNVAGIQCLEPGYKTVLIAPQMDGPISHSQASYVSYYGEIRVQWERQSEQLCLTVNIPCNSTANIVLPLPQDAIDENGQLLREHPQISDLSSDAVSTRFALASGQYQFTCRLTA